MYCVVKCLFDVAPNDYECYLDSFAYCLLVILVFAVVGWFVFIVVMVMAVYYVRLAPPFDSEIGEGDC